MTPTLTQPASKTRGQRPGSRKAPSRHAPARGVTASYGGKDRSLRGAAARLEKALTAAGVEHDVRSTAGRA